MKAGTLS